ncbi:MAG TPA: hypothetical protein VLI72_13780 [Methylibium sp.]|nr:hypothetical protein [Methylibium sp.]
MPPAVAAVFERDTAGTEAEWLMRLPGACGRWTVCIAARCATVAFEGDGRLELAWQPLPPRRIARLVMERLAVSYRFHGVDAAERARFMQHFDLYMQRGGG